MAERNGHHCVGLRSRVRRTGSVRTDSIRAGLLRAEVDSSDSRIRHHVIVRLCAAASKGAVDPTAPFCVVATPARGGVRQHGGH